MHLGSFPACIHNSIYMHAKHEQILNCHCFNISHITSNRTFWGLIFGSEIFWVLIFAPIRSFLLLEIWSTPLVHTDYYCSEKALTSMYTSALYLRALCASLTPADNLSRQLTHKSGQNVL